MLLSGLWLAARLMIVSSGLWPPLLVALVDLAFLPVLGALIAGPLLRAGNRNTPLLAVLMLLWLMNVIFYAGLLQQNPPLALQALHIGIDVMLVLVTVIGGRIVPAFTGSALRPLGAAEAVRNSSLLTVLAVVAMVLIALADIFMPDSRVAGLLAAVAALIQLWRLSQWATHRTLRLPIVWVLHLAYIWLPIGLALKALAILLQPAFAAFWLHALTIGALTTMIVGVMTRASLGHTGRPLVVDPLITLAYLLLTVAALLRVFGLAVPGLNYVTVIALAGLCWTVAFALFVAVYAPILWGPRVDGKSG
jgi:uncharacterized protein involved in response to NO